MLRDRILLIAEGVRSNIAMVYPLLVVYAGFWARVRLVWFVTVAAVLGYSLLVLDSHLWRPRLAIPADSHLIFVAVVLATAAVTSLQVRRARTLRRFLSRRGGVRP